MPEDAELLNAQTENVVCTEETQGRNTSLLIPSTDFVDAECWYPGCTADSVRSAKSMIPRPDDIFICTYPKSGTNWMEYIVHQLLGSTESVATDDSNNAMRVVSPRIEKAGAVHCETLKAPRVLFSHFNYQNMPKGGGAKYINVCRNPKDVLNSYYHHHRNIKAYDFENGDFNYFYERFMNGKVGYGDYFDHLTSWLNGFEKGDETILIVKYEDMLSDLPAAIVRIAKFLGENAARLIENEQQLARICDASTFESMAQNKDRWRPTAFRNRGELIRKGRARDWKTLFSLEQSNRMDERFRQRLAATAAPDWWQAEMLCSLN